jgi:pimeloyl-ACP methyl ester carboxylesterase
MTVALVHGNPDTYRVWDELRAALGDIKTAPLCLPGFGVPVPPGFGCTREDYLEWLVAELEAFGGPVDLVGHDIGSMLIQGVLQTRPDLVRSWVCGGAVCDSTYVWHRRAQLWQRERVGERTRDVWLRLSQAQRVEGLRASGMPENKAILAADHLDESMYTAMLALYRSCISPGDWELEADREYPPGAVIWGAQDPFQAVEFGERLAKRTGAELTVFEECGHWWQVERPAEVARVLRDLWSRADQISRTVPSSAGASPSSVRRSRTSCEA